MAHLMDPDLDAEPATSVLAAVRSHRTEANGARFVRLESQLPGRHRPALLRSHGVAGNDDELDSARSCVWVGQQDVVGVDLPVDELGRGVGVRDGHVVAYGRDSCDRLLDGNGRQDHEGDQHSDHQSDRQMWPSPRTNVHCPSRVVVDTSCEVLPEGVKLHLTRTTIL